MEMIYCIFTLYKFKGVVVPEGDVIGHDAKLVGW
jgi:hypothetical protein